MAAFTANAGEKIGHVFVKLPEPLPAPDIAFKDAGGKTRGLVEFRGKLLILYVWATWCPVCTIDMPNLDRLQAKLNSRSIAIIPLSIDRGESQIIHSYYKKHGFRFLEIYRDQDSLLAAVMGVRGTPTAFLINPLGLVIGISEGAANWDAPEVARALEEIKPSQK
jgi:peroxiredoxin